jgi:hypothetical protein
VTEIIDEAFRPLLERRRTLFQYGRAAATVLLGKSRCPKDERPTEKKGE